VKKFKKKISFKKILENIFQKQILEKKNFEKNL